MVASGRFSSMLNQSGTFRLVAPERLVAFRKGC